MDNKSGENTPELGSQETIGQMASVANLPSGNKASGTTVIKSYEEIAPGDHISLPWYWGDYCQPRHMLVVEVDTLRRRVKVIHYHSRSKSKDYRKPSHTVIDTWEPIDPAEDKVCRYNYKQNDTFSTVHVLVNAHQCLGKKRPELKNIISPNYCKLVSSSSCRFVEWCKTGKGWNFVNPTPPGDIPEHCGAKYLGMTCISSVNELEIADHVALVDKYGGLTHGIVDSIYHMKGHIHVITYNVKDDSKPMAVQLVTWYFGTKNYRQVYRYNYGMNQCVDSGNVLQRAQRKKGATDLGNIVPDITECSDWSLMSLYFVRWCKVGKGWAYEPVVETPLKDWSELVPGDHIEIKRIGGCYSHHAIIENVKRDMLTGTVLHVDIIHNVKHSETKDKNSVIEIKREPLDEDQTYLNFKSGVVHKVNYHQNDCLDTVDVIARARSLIGRRNYHLMSFNCEHFARWCKTGEERSLQVVEICKTIFRGIVGVSERFFVAAAANVLADMFEASLPAFICCHALAIAGDLVAVSFIMKKEHDCYMSYATDLEKLLAMNKISKEVCDQKLRKYQVQAVTRLAGLILGLIIGEIVELFIPVPVVRNIVALLIAGAGFLLGHGLGFLLNILIDKIVVMLPKIKAKVKEIFKDDSSGHLGNLITDYTLVFEQYASSARCLEA